MGHACIDNGIPIANRIATMKKSLTGLEALQEAFPDLTVKSDGRKDIYQSKSIWKDADQLEIVQNHDSFKVLPFRDIRLIFSNYDQTHEFTYRLYTDPMDITLVKTRYKWDDNIKLSDQVLIISIQNYMEKLRTTLYSDYLLKKIELVLYDYVKGTIVAEPKRYKIENEENMPEKFQTLITFV
jgi:hypothetical protein